MSLSLCNNFVSLVLCHLLLRRPCRWSCRPSLRSAFPHGVIWYRPGSSASPGNWKFSLRPSFWACFVGGGRPVVLRLFSNISGLSSPDAGSTLTLGNWNMSPEVTRCPREAELPLFVNYRSRDLVGIQRNSSGKLRRRGGLPATLTWDTSCLVSHVFLFAAWQWLVLTHPPWSSLQASPKGFRRHWGLCHTTVNSWFCLSLCTYYFYLFCKEELTSSTAGNVAGICSKQDTCLLLCLYIWALFVYFYFRKDFTYLRWRGGVGKSRGRGTSGLRAECGAQGGAWTHDPEVETCVELESHCLTSWAARRPRSL